MGHEGGDADPNSMDHTVVVVGAEDLSIFLDHVKVSKKRCNNNVHRVARTKSTLANLRRAAKAAV